MPRASRPVSVALGNLRPKGQPAMAERLRQRVDESLSDPKSDVPADKVFKRLRAHHARRVKARGNKKV
jgi:hypothetical protein